MNDEITRNQLKRLDSLTALALFRAAAASSSGLIPIDTWAVAAWFIDPVNGSDTTGTGKTAGSPFKTWRRLTVAWRTNSPILAQVTTVTFLNSQPDDSDPVVITPTVRGGGLLIVTGTPAMVANIVLASTTGKLRATPQLLQTDLGASGAINRMVENTTAAKTSRAFVYKNVAGTVFSMSQPLALQNPQTQGAFPPPAEVDTWANGDTATIKTLPRINIVKVAPVWDEPLSAPAIQPVVLNLLSIMDPAASAGTNPVELHNCALEEVICERSPSTVENVFAFNVDFVGGFGLYGDAFWSNVGMVFLGGILRAGAFGWPGQMLGATLDGDLIIGAFTSAVSQASLAPLAPTFFGLVYIETGTKVSYAGLSLGSSFYGTGKPIVWGPGVHDSIGRCLYGVGTNATGVFVNTGGLKIAGRTTAHSLTSGSPDVLNGGITLNVTNLDAATGAAGFGGLAFDFQGASFDHSTAV